VSMDSAVGLGLGLTFIDKNEDMFDDMSNIASIVSPMAFYWLLGGDCGHSLASSLRGETWHHFHEFTVCVSTLSEFVTLSVRLSTPENQQ
jgi:hypothetical protein